MDNFSRNVRTGFGVSLLLLLLSSFASYYSIRELISSSRLVDHTQRVLLESENLISHIKDGETGQRGYLLTGQSDFLRPYEGAYGRAQQSIKELRRLTSDNLQQQNNCDTLQILVSKRFAILARSIDSKAAGDTINLPLLREGHTYMQQARMVVDRIQQVEQLLLEERTASLNKFISYSPLLIVAAAVIAVVITFVFFRRIISEFSEKSKLAQSLRIADQETKNRIHIIDTLAGKIAGGDYSIRVDAAQNDQLGTLSGSLNRMAASLEQTFDDLSKREWLQTGVAGVSESVSGEKTMEEVAGDSLQFISEYTGSMVGAFYIADSPSTLRVAGGYAIPVTLMGANIKNSEGLAGQCYMSRRIIRIDEVEETLYTPVMGGTLHPRHILASPVFFEKKVVGVIELGSVYGFTAEHERFLQGVAEIIGVTINTASNRAKLKELLEETQSQSEELQAQHRELENMNAELEAQTEKLQTSEEELKVQQEELQETNMELEERSRLLEEKNHLVVVRNLEIQKKAEELEQSTRYKSEFLANMSHELRTPLNSVLLLSRLLSENNTGNLSADQVEYAQVIQSSGQGLLQLIDEILDLSKIEAGKLELDFERIQVNDIVHHMRSLFGPMAKEKNIELRMEVASQVPPVIETDKLRVEQILKNLLSNALKFTHTGFIELKIEKVPENDSFISLAVKDTGIGIPEEKQQLVFEAFQQADGSTKRKFGGTGLGLSISRQLARLLSGEITLKSAPDQGSTFTLVIPVMRTANKEYTKAEQSDKSLPALEEPVIAPPAANPLLAAAIPLTLPDDRDLINLSDKVLLIVEDDLSFARALLDFAHNKGYKAVHVVRGDEVIQFAKQYRPVGILLDIQLPVKDGLSVLDDLKAEHMTRHIPVHIMSSFEARKESISRGAIDFINKPVAFEQMNEVLGKIEHIINTDQKKVLIVEDNSKHAEALAYFLSTHNVNSEICTDIRGSIGALERKEVNCVILDLDNPAMKAYETLDEVKQHATLDGIPIIVFTGKSFTRNEEQRIRQYADTIVVKTAHSYQRILNEVSLFLHLMEKPEGIRGLGRMDEVLKNKTVLITDDDVRNIFALTKALEKHQINVLTAVDGKEALRILEGGQKVDIVLMDMMMPEMDGYETTANIKRNPRLKHIPVIAVTAKAMAGDREKCIQAGASDYISKPVDTDQLLSLMRVWLYDSK